MLRHKTERATNMKKTTQYLEYNDVIMGIEDWSHLLNIDYETLNKCLVSCAFDLEKAVEQTGLVKLSQLRRI